MKLGIDLDDVVAVACVAYLKRFAAEYSVELPDEESLGWHLLDTFEHLVPRAERDRFRTRTYDGTFFAELETYDGVSGALDSIVNAGHEIHFITARSERRRVVTETWLREKDLLRYAQTVRLKPRGDFIPTARPGAYDPDSSGRYKARVARELGLDAFCEDDPVVAEAIADAGVRVWLFDRPWNRDAEHRLIRRVRDWADVTGIIAREGGA